MRTLRHEFQLYPNFNCAYSHFLKRGMNSNDFVISCHQQLDFYDFEIRWVATKSYTFIHFPLSINCDHLSVA